MTPFPPSEGDTGATNMPDPGQSAPEGVQAVRDDLSGSVWRVGRSLGRTLYRQVGDDPSKSDEFVGIMDTRELAELVRDALNARVSVDDDTESPAAAAVREFHVAFDLPINDATRTLNKLRADLIREEAEETAEAVESGDLKHTAKELADLAYVVYGAALTLGIDLDRAIAEVHRSNMSKLVDGKPVMRPDGKVLKGPNYQPPDMRAAVQALRDGSGT